MNTNISTNELRHAVGTFSTREDAEYALRELRDARFNMDKVSVVANNPKREDSIGGKEVMRIKLPAKKVSCITFGGENYDRLFISTAREQKKIH